MKLNLPTMTILYGIKNCDTVKKAKTWLEAHHPDFSFHDFRSDGISIEMIDQWLKHIAKDKLVNKRSTTWKQLDDNQKKLFDSDILSEHAKQLLVAQPTLIKRPVLVHEEKMLVGFNANDYINFLN